jgi:hypothetical protein
MSLSFSIDREAGCPLVSRWVTQEQGCAHFEGVNCRLAQRIAQGLPEVTDTLPPCRVRQNCRWWLQEGKAACFRLSIG